MRNFAKLDTAPLNSPPSLFSVPCHPQTVKHHNENPLSCHPFPPKLLPTCENIGLQSRLRKNRTSDPSAPQILTGLPQPHLQPHPQPHPQPLPGDPQPQPQPHPSRSQATPSHTSIRPQCTPPSAPTLPPHPSHTPDVPLPPQIRMQFPNRSDSMIQSDTNKQVAQRELHAKLQHLRPLAGPVATPHGGHRAQAATHPDR